MPGAKPPKVACVYAKKVTWHESMRASIAAAFGPTVDKDYPTGTGAFAPAIVRK